MPDDDELGTSEDARVLLGSLNVMRVGPELLEVDSTS